MKKSEMHPRFLLLNQGFKKNIKAKPPDWFYCGERYISIIHARMRMLCSPLNDHSFSHIHVVDSPACDCGHSRESIKHYFLECPMYITDRDVLLMTLQSLHFVPSLTNILYGDKALSPVTNTKAFACIHVFMKCTKRFD